MSDPSDPDATDPDFPDDGDPGTGVTATAGAEEDRIYLQANFEDLPLVREVRELLVQRGYNERDPARLNLDVAAAFARQCKAMMNQMVHVAAVQTEAIRELKEELASLSIELEEVRGSNDRAAENQAVLAGMFDKVLKVCAQLTPFLERAAGEIVRAAGIIENRSVKAMILSYLSPAIALCAGFLIAQIFR